jgi:RimJ/RimL family protein N-acetyltransferase
VSVDVVRAAVDSARVILAEVNPRMPRTAGDTRIDVRLCTHLVPVDALLPERPAPVPDAISTAIGAEVADLVPDGATLQVGIGAAPSAILEALTRHHDLGIHTEMLSDGVMKLVQAGVVTGRRKSLLPGKVVASFVMGSQSLYAWADGNSDLELRPSEWVNDPAVIARNDRMVSINTALAVDLTGQVAGDTLDGTYHSGIGGRVDFVRGAARSREGRSLIVLPSLTWEGASRVQPALSEGSIGATGQGDVRYVVTEYGAADLWGKSMRERALALVAIAHPDHRSDLMAAAKRRRWVLPDQPVPKMPFERRAWDETLPDGTRLRVRAARATDERAVHELLYAISRQSAYQRYFSAREIHPRSEVLDFLDTDPRSSCALVAERSSDSALIGIARYDLDGASRMGELGIIVRDDCQHRGVGTALVHRLLEVGLAHGMKGLRADVLVGNAGMMALLRRFGPPEVSSADAGIHSVDLVVEGRAQLLRSAA